jgi:chromosome transmission fidelity protein 1
MPYTTLFSESARASFGLEDLSRAIILFDEAHNITEAVSSQTTVTLTIHSLAAASSLLIAYMNNLKNKLSSSSTYHLGNLNQLIQNILKYFRKVAAENKGGLLQIHEVLDKSRCLEYDLTALRNFIETANVGRKLAGWRERSKTANSEKESFVNIETIFEFFSCLLRAYKFDSNINMVIDTTTPDNTTITYLPLDISPTFEEIVNSALAVLFTGGTMKPKGQLESILASTAKKLTMKDFPSVIPQRNILTIIVPRLSSTDILFNHANHSNLSTCLTSLTNLLLAVEGTVQGGILVFFTSYANLKEFKGVATKRLKSEFGREVFFDGEDEVFERYGLAVRKSGKAALFSVMGGRLSEGINFKDDLARLVVVVGLPYPNQHSPELKLKMHYFDSKASTTSTAQLDKSTTPNFTISGSDYYTSLCMKVINQTVGRSVRHKNDYATIILFDKRFKNDNTLQGMPQWVVGNRLVLEKEQDIADRIADFTKQMRSSSN